MARNLLSNSNITADFPLSNLSAFGDIITNHDHPVIQLDFIGDTINTYLCTTTVANSATIDQNLSRIRIQSGTNSAGSAIFRSNKIAKYRPGQGMKARWTRVFATGVANSTQISGVGNSVDGYFFGYNGTSFGILHRNNSNDNWITSFNGEGLPTGFKATLGNVYQIVYPYLGYGSIYFFILKNTGEWSLVHTIRYPNTDTSVQITNPNLFFYDHVLNSGNTTNRIGYIGSVSVFLSGDRKFLGFPGAIANLKTGITTQTNILTLRNATTFNNSVNRKVLRPNNLSVSWDGGNGTCLINLISNTTLGGSPSYTTINGTSADSGVTITAGQSCISYDTAGTTITGGQIIWNTTLARNSNHIADISELNLFLSPGETWTFAATGQVSGDCRVAINWTED